MRLNKLIRTLALAVALAWGGTQAKAAYSYSIGNGGLVAGFSVTVDGNSESGIYVGGILLSEVTPGSPPPPYGPVPGYKNFTTVCVDLGGRVWLGSTYTFDRVVFSGETGLSPLWGNPLSNPQNTALAYEAINNAAYVFAHNTPTTATAWAAMQLAVWKAIYDTDANGKIVWDDSKSRFKVVTDPTSGGIAWTTAQGWLADLPKSPDYVGYLLKPHDLSAQEMIIGVTPVPEPTTMIAGAFLLVPFGMSIMRTLRNNRAE